MDPENKKDENVALTSISDWIQCICVVTFDLNLGQAMELIYPPSFALTEQESSNICYMAFPDSNSGCMGDSKFHIRLRRSAHYQNNQPEKDPFRSYNMQCLPQLRADQSHYWGFVYFRQKRDKTIPRGYFQKSLILITRLPFFNIFFEVLTNVALRFFENGSCVIEDAFKQITQEWPKLRVNVPMNLTLFDQNYHICIPKANSNKQHHILNVSLNNSNIETKGDEVNAVATKTFHSINELEIYPSLGFVVDNLLTLWELVITAEPIIVLGTSPSDCSHTVQTLTSLIAPLEYCAEVRPYFTIHDSEFQEFTREHEKGFPAVILGVTNPFFVKLFDGWPHILRLVEGRGYHQKTYPVKVETKTNTSATSFSNTNSSNAPFRKNNTSSDGVMPGLHTKYKPFLKKDKALIEKILMGAKMKRPDHVQTALIRRHLLELTQSFMIPLERYLASLMPLQKDISPFKSVLNANSFKLENFLSTLDLSGPQLTSTLKGDWKGLYRRFFYSSNFRGWYKSRHSELEMKLQDIQLKALSDMNLKNWAQDKQEVEIIDMILKLKQKLNVSTNHCADGVCSRDQESTDSIQRQIREQINCMRDLLPLDLRNVVNI